MLAKEMLLSIIIPAYNIQFYIESCVRSVTIDDHEDWEIIIVDDCSTDDTLIVCRRLEQEIKGVRLIEFSKNQGVSAARNAAIAAAKGKYLTFIDGDDLIESGTFESNLSLIESDSSIDAIHFPIQVEKHGETINRSKSPKGLCTSKHEILENVFKYRGGFYFWGYLFRKSLFENLQFEVGRAIAEDTVLFPDLVSKMNAIFFSQEGTYLYILRDDSATFKSMSYSKIFQFAESTYIGMSKIIEMSGTKNYVACTLFITLVHLFAKMKVKGDKEGVDDKRILEDIRLLSGSNFSLNQVSLKKMNAIQGIQLILIGLFGVKFIVRIEVIIRKNDYLFELFRNRNHPRID